MLINDYVFAEKIYRCTSGVIVAKQTTLNKPVGITMDGSIAVRKATAAQLRMSMCVYI